MPLGGIDFYNAHVAFHKGDRRRLLSLLAQNPALRDEALMTPGGFYAYYNWAEALTRYDVSYSNSSPLAAYFSGRPYCVCSVGADLQFDCGRMDDLGRLMVRSFNAAHLLMISNPHSLGHSRRLGLTNGVHLPYPMDSGRYCPGRGVARARWNAQFGEGVYVLTTARLDGGVKGHDDGFFEMLVRVCRDFPRVKFVFLRWGVNADRFADRIAQAGLGKQLLLMSPVGKIRLIDYYRSCDIVLDQFVYGYYGATGLEAAAVGKPVIMKMRTEQYDALYGGDAAPAVNVSTPDEIYEALAALVSDADLRERVGVSLREWLVRTHGEQRTGPLLLALLRLAADRVPLPKDLVSPLLDPETEEEAAYHAACLVAAP